MMIQIAAIIRVSFLVILLILCLTNLWATAKMERNVETSSCAALWVIGAIIALEALGK
jgi:hypothetical protein